MSRDELEIGLKTIKGYHSNGKEIDVAKRIVHDVLQTVNHQRIPIRAAWLLASPDWCQSPISISKLIRDELNRELGYGVPLLGGSMAGIYCFNGKPHFLSHGIALLLLCSEDLWMTVDCLENPYSLTNEEREESLRTLATRIQKRAGTRQGAGAFKHLLGLFPGFVSDNVEECKFFDCELHSDVCRVFDYRYQIFGCSTADKLNPTIGYQFANDQCFESSLVLGILETDHLSGSATSHGFRPLINRPPVSVDEILTGDREGYIISKLDGKPAKKCIEKLQHQLGHKKVLLGLRNDPDYNIVVPLGEPPNGLGAMRFSRKLSKGELLYILKSDAKHTLDNIQIAVDQVRMRSHQMERSKLDLLFGFICTGLMGSPGSAEVNWRRVTREFHQQFPGTFVLMGLCAGEYGIDVRRQTRANSMSVSLASLVGTRSLLSVTRQTQKTLLGYQAQLRACDRPMEVMRIAMEGVVAAGIKGGQICVVDSVLGRIMNQGYGYAVNAIDSKQNWKLVGEETNRLSPKDTRELPPYLKQYSIPVFGSQAQSYSHRGQRRNVLEAESKDILTLATETRHAILSLNTQDPRFHSDAPLSKRANIVTHLAIPVFGLDDHPIITVQFGLNDYEIPDRESMTLLVAYANVIGAELQRTQEKEEREVIERIRELMGKLVRKGLRPGESPYYWCNEYLREIVGLLGADGGHMRIFRDTTSGGVYELVGAVGYLAPTIRKTRSETREEDGGVNRSMLAHGGAFANTQEEARALGKRAHAVEHKELDELYQREHDRIVSTALLPLKDDKDLRGSFVIDSLKPFFFGERHQRLAQAAADCAGIILRSLSEEYLRHNQEEETRNMLQSLTESSQLDPDQRLRNMIDHLRFVVQADVASLYVWHKEAQKLFLRIGCNWHNQNCEGEVSYEQGVGWTGSILWESQDDDVFIVSPSHHNKPHCSHTHYTKMVPPEYRSNDDQVDARIGIRLGTRSNPAGVLTFAYYYGNEDKLIGRQSYLAGLLRHLAPVFTLYVQATMEQSTFKLWQALGKTQREVGKALVTVTESGCWRPVIDILRKGLQVDHAMLYVFDGKLLHLSASASDCEFPDIVNPIGFLGDVITGADISIQDPKDASLNLLRTIMPIKPKTVLAHPVLSTDRRVKGILLFFNRHRTREHPADFLIRPERSMVTYMANAIGAAINHIEDKNASRELWSKYTAAVKLAATTVAAGLMMHQLKTQLARIRWSVAWMKYHPNRTETETTTRLSSIEESVSGLENAINRAKSDGVVGVQNCNLRKIVSQALRAIQPVPTGIQTKIKNEAKAYVRANAFSITGALMNLMQNSLDEMGNEGTLTVETSASKDSRYAFVKIHNTGPHYTAEQVEKFMMPNFSTKDQGEHLGLGLPLAETAINAIKGAKITLTSPEQGGILVTIELLAVIQQREKR